MHSTTLTRTSLRSNYWRYIFTRNFSNIGESFTHCAEMVKKLDYENYICALHLEKEKKAAIIAIRALNAEVASIPDRIQQPTIAMMRLVWWRDAIESLFKGKVLDHPILKALHLVTSNCKLTKRWFDRLIEARIEDLQNSSSPFTMKDIEDYAESTSGALMYLSLEAANIRSISADHIASHIGKAQGICLLLRGMPHHFSNRRSYLPLDITAKYGVVEEHLFSGKGSPNLPDVVLEIASVAHSHLLKAQTLAASVPPEVQPLFLPAVPVSLYLNELEKKNFDILHKDLRRGVAGVSHLWLNYQLAKKAYSKTF